MILMLSTGCGLFASGANKQEEDLGEMRVQSNTQWTADDDLRIAAGNIAWDDYTDEDGNIEDRISGRLWFYFKDDSSKNTSVQVFIGQEVCAGGEYSVYVADIVDDDAGGYVDIEVNRGCN